jgi:hypothetical protein
VYSVKPCFDLFLQVADDLVTVQDMPPPFQVFPAANTFVAFPLANGPASPAHAWTWAVPLLSIPIRLPT